MSNRAGSILEGHSKQIRSAPGDGVVGAIDDEAVNGNVSRVRHQESDGERFSVEKTGGIGLHTGRHENGAVFRGEGERNVNGDLLDVDTLADVDGVAGRSGVDSVLNLGEGGGRAIDFIVIDEDDFGKRSGRGQAVDAKEQQGRAGEGLWLHEFPLVRNGHTAKDS